LVLPVSWLLNVKKHIYLNNNLYFMVHTAPCKR